MAEILGVKRRVSRGRVKSLIRELSTPYYFDRSFTTTPRIRYRSLRSPTAPTSSPAFKTQTPACFDFLYNRRTLHISTPIPFQYLWPGSSNGAIFKMFGNQKFRPLSSNSHRFFALTTGFGM
ncbi:hypothetical protein AVEN_176793-1 [Araneus ventricosus]|uniref:Uncharacterized protein n=1 Tax=Araneus ventricosus TaxID=182803 RepID=A0A4Y2VKG3_ARAVE|nr:hypothetical protein AVEN_176793-1 [Araneus ventricosus]